MRNGGNNLVTNCYTLCSLPNTGVGFAPSGVLVGTNCIWVKDTGSVAFNTGVTAASAGVVKTFAELSKISGLTSKATAKPFRTTNGTIYPYSITGVTHMGDWPFNPAMKGYIGIARRISSSSSKFLYYDGAAGTTNTVTTLFSSMPSNGYYIFLSGDLYPGFETGGWTTNYGGTLPATGSWTSNSGYLFTSLSTTYFTTSRPVIFYLDGVEMFRIIRRSNGDIAFG